MRQKNQNPDMSSARAIRRGFTLIEIVVVVTIIAILASIIIPKVWSRVGQARVNVAKAGVQEIAKQLHLYLMDNSLSSPPDDLSMGVLAPKYVKPKDLNDPWGHPYQLKVPGDHNPDEFDIISYGADGALGGEGDNADIYND